jgi:hypothetical protein
MKGPQRRNVANPQNVSRAEIEFEAMLKIARFAGATALALLVTSSADAQTNND